MKRLALAVLVAAVFALPASAEAAFPGKNGKIAFAGNTSGQTGIHTINPDGTGLTFITTGNGPAWSRDGTRIAFSRLVGSDQEIFVMNAEGSGQVDVTNNPARDSDPAWSPDGSKIVFSSNRDGTGGDIYTMNPDGSAVTRLTNDAGDDYAPVWSPHGSKIAFVHHNSFTTDLHTMNADGSGDSGALASGNDLHGGIRSVDWSPDGSKLAFDDQEGSAESDIYTINPDGTGKTSLTGDSQTGYDQNPAWSPDGAKIAFIELDPVPPQGINVWQMNPDGTAKTRVTPSGAVNEREPDWQPLPTPGPGYPRPKGATPFQTYLTVAYKQCVAPNEQHGAPLAVLACNPPQQASDYLTVGTLDANGQDANAVGVYRLDVRASPADVKIGFALQDVRNKLDLSDYTGELRVTENWRMTDHYSGPIGGPAGSEAATSTDINFPPLDVACAATTDTTVGATCNMQSSANAALPGAVQPGKRVNSELGQVRVQDGGADGVGATQGDNTLFMDEGVFVP